MMGTNRFYREDRQGVQGVMSRARVGHLAGDIPLAGWLLFLMQRYVNNL